jgi:hypothetical protein
MPSARANENVATRSAWSSDPLSHEGSKALESDAIAGGVRGAAPPPPPSAPSLPGGGGGGGGRVAIAAGPPFCSFAQLDQSEPTSSNSFRYCLTPSCSRSAMEAGHCATAAER